MTVSLVECIRAPGLLGGTWNRGIDSTGLGTTRVFVTEQGRVERTCRLVRGCGIRRNRMRDDPSDQLLRLAPAKSVSRRTMISLTAKFAAGAALAVVSSARIVPLAAAQDEIILTAAASEVGAKPGSAFARGAAAYAAADQDAGATTQAGLTPIMRPAGVRRQTRDPVRWRWHARGDGVRAAGLERRRTLETLRPVGHAPT